MTTQDAAWYALWVKPRHEKSVQRLLTIGKYRALTPLYSTRHRWADRFHDVELPLFPGYVFCHFDAAWRREVLRTPGVIDVVRIGSQPAPIADSEINALEYVMGVNLAMEPWPGLITGDSVVIVSGPLTGLTGVVIELKNKLRLVLGVTLLQRSVLLEIDRSSLIPARRGPGIARPGKSAHDTPPASQLSNSSLVTT